MDQVLFTSAPKNAQHMPRSMTRNSACGDLAIRLNTNFAAKSGGLRAKISPREYPFENSRAIHRHLTYSPCLCEDPSHLRELFSNILHLNLPADVEVRLPFLQMPELLQFALDNLLKVQMVPGNLVMRLRGSPCVYTLFHICFLM